MAFTIYGPGIRDNVLVENLLRDRNVEAVNKVTAAKPVGEGEPQELESGAQQQLARSFANRAYRSTTELPRERERAIRAHQIMTSPVITVPMAISIRDAWNIFRQRRFRSLPVVDEVGKIIGIVSDRDLLRYAAVTGNIPPYGEDSEQASTPIEPLVSKKVLTATPDTEIRTIARLMFEQRVGVMPIVDAYENLVGIITRSDILRTLVNQAPLELWV